MNVFIKTLKIYFLILVTSGHLSTDVIESLSARIRAEWKKVRIPRLPDIITAARLAHHGLLGSVEYLFLRDVDLSSVPPEHLASLAACVTECVEIGNVSNTDLTSILDKSKSKWLRIFNQNLSTQETQALVRAMRKVEGVELGIMGEDVTLDISTLVTYGGQGKCKRVTFCYGTVDKYGEKVRGWAQAMSWRVTRDNRCAIFIERK